MALNLAYQQIQALGSSAYSSNGVLNVIVFFTDGFPNGLTALYPPKDKVDDRYCATDASGNTTGTPFCTSMPATTAQCISSLQAYITNNDPNGAGGIAQWANGMYPYGNTHAYSKLRSLPRLVPAATRALSAYQSATNTANGCYFTSGGSSPTYGSAGMRQDVAYIPAMDFYGNRRTAT